MIFGKCFFVTSGATLLILRCLPTGRQVSLTCTFDTLSSNDLAVLLKALAAVQECDATMFDSSTSAGHKIIFYKDRIIVSSGTKNNTGAETFYLNGLGSLRASLLFE